MPLADQGLQTYHVSWFLFPLLAYLLGSIPFGKFLAQWVAGIDITQRGSGNIGATNVAREVGLKWGILTLLLDAFKGFLPVFLFLCLFPQSGLIQGLVALSVLIGHQYSLYLRFRGGKGAASAVGIVFALSPVAGMIALFAFILTVSIWRYVSVGSMVFACVTPFAFIVLGKSGALTTAALIMAALICLNHKDNISRLVKGQERKWGKGARREDQGDDPIPHQNRKK